MRKIFLGEILMLLSEIKVEIKFVSLPLCELFRKIERSCVCRNLDFIGMCLDEVNEGEDFSVAWNKAVFSSDLPMKKEEREKLSGLGTFLGTSDLQGQLALISLFSENFSQFYKTAQEDFQKYGKTSITVSGIVAAGLFIFLM